MNNPLLFNTTRHRRNRQRAKSKFEKHHFLFQKSAHSIRERLSFIKRDFQKILVLNSPDDTLFSFLKIAYPNAVIHYAVSEDLLKAPSDYDCILSLLSLHWENNLPATLQTIHTCLQPDGVFIVSLFGNETLMDLRHCFIEVESDLYGSVTPHIAPAIDIKSLGQLMQKAGFDEPVMDCENYTVLHSSLISLFHDLRGMGENNALHSPARMITRLFLKRLEQNYAEKTRQNDGFLATHFDVLYAIGWKRKPR